MIIPEAVVPLFLRATRANAPFLTVKSARRAMRASELRPETYGPPSRLGPGLHVDVARKGGAPVYTVAPTQSTPTGAVIYTHGGGWIHEISTQHWTLIAQIAVEANVTVTVPIYTLLPFGTAQDAHDLVYGLAKDLISEHGAVRLAGDSAGGQIALSVAQTLRDSGFTVPTVLISPAPDLSFTNPRIPEVQRTDPWLARDGGQELGKRWAGSLSIDNPIASPIHGSFDNLGPMLLFSGTRDVLNPDTHLLVNKARQAGIDLTFRELPGAVHVYPLLPTRNGRTARAEIVTTLRS